MTRYIVSQKLDFEPGLRYAYGNSAYQILGRVIERVTGKSYEDAVRERILTPSGATSIRVGRALAEGRFPDEVKYYDYPGAPLVAAPAVPGSPRPAPRPYAANWPEMSESFGGMLGTSIDLMKYINAIEGRRGRPLLQAPMLNTMVQRPAAPAAPAS